MTWLLLCTKAFTATLSVGGVGADYTSIQAAIDNSTDGDIIDVQTATYDEALVLDGRQLTILGNQSTLAPSSPTDVIRWSNGAQSTLKDFVILPAGARAFYSSDSEAVVENCNVEGAGTSSGLNGGSLYVDGGSVTLNNVSFDQSAGQWGGTVYAQNNAVLDWTQVEIRNSSASYGGALYLDNTTLTGSEVHIEDSESTLTGAGLYLKDTSLNITDFELRSAQGNQSWGAGIYANSSTITLSQAVLSDCAATDYASGYGGGAIRAEGSTVLDFFDVGIDNSTAYFGGGISLASGSSATLVEFSAENNLADNVGLTASGGALHIGNASQASCENCIFTSNYRCPS